MLKDASATAIYGSEAANGVIVITTKKRMSVKFCLLRIAGISPSGKTRYGLYNQMNSGK